MKTKALITVLVSAALILTAPFVTLGAGPGSGSGSGGGNAGTAAGLLYGDLYVIERDGNGEPVVTKFYDSNGIEYPCQRPIASTCMFLPLNVEKPDFNPELEDACAVQAESTYLLQAVSFGRESVSRAPATVIDKSYAEAIKAINLARPDTCMKTDNSDFDSRAIKLDPAGRITLCIPDAAGAYAWKTIDAPLENLGLYRAAMTNGCFGPVTDNVIGEEGVPMVVTYQLSQTAIDNLAFSGLGHLSCSGTLPNPVTKADMLSASVFIAAGADKSSRMYLDQIINVNNYLGINTWAYTRVNKTRTLTIDYFDFIDGGGWFKYTRGVDACKPGADDSKANLLTTNNNGTTFLPSLVDVFGDSSNGVDLSDVGIKVCRNGLPLAASGQNVVCNDATNNPVYSSSNTSGCGGANWFTQAAEDARKTIWYLHNWRLPVVDY